jgi:hypothetical protein
MAKEAASSISAAYDAYRKDQVVASGTYANVLTPYLNYVKTSTLDIDYFYTGANRACALDTCIVLHNGGVLSFFGKFDGNTATDAVMFEFDPDGVYGGTTNGPGKSVQFWLYYNGQITSRQYLKPNTYSNTTVYQPCTNCDPPWFSWN